MDTLRIFLILISLFCFHTTFGQKVLQLEKIGKVATTKIYLGESIYLRTKDHPDYWYYAEIEDVIVEAQAIVFADRIIPIKDIISIRRKKKGALNGLGKSLQFSAVVPATYEIIFGLVEPPINWESIAYLTSSSFMLGTIFRLFPPKQFRMDRKYRLRVLDLTFYPVND